MPRVPQPPACDVSGLPPSSTAGTTLSDVPRAAPSTGYLPGLPPRQSEPLLPPPPPSDAPSHRSHRSAARYQSPRGSPRVSSRSYQSPRGSHRSQPTSPSRVHGKQPIGHGRRAESVEYSDSGFAERIRETLLDYAEPCREVTSLLDQLWTNYYAHYCDLNFLGPVEGPKRAIVRFIELLTDWRIAGINCIDIAPWEKLHVAIQEGRQLTQLPAATNPITPVTSDTCWAEDVSEQQHTLGDI